jgi:ABC-type glycerol-3-phosphate transport system permease component
MATTVAAPRQQVLVKSADRHGERPNPLLKLLAYAALVGMALIMFIPFLWSITTSLKTNPEAALIPPTQRPQSPTHDP